MNERRKEWYATINRLIEEKLDEVDIYSSIADEAFNEMQVINCVKKLRLVSLKRF